MLVGSQNKANRAKWLEQKLTAITAKSRILDVGAGEQQYKKFCSHLNYVSQDFAKYDGNGDFTGLQTINWDQSGLDIVCDIMDIPEPDASFDAIMCIEVLEHLPRPVEAIKEISRLIRSGGVLILTAPFCSLTHFAPYHFHTGFNRYFYETHLPANDLEILEIQHNGNFFDYIAQELRRIPYIAQRYSDNRHSPLDKFVVHLVLKLLERLSRQDKGSSELLCFGYHVLAIKK